MTATLFALYLAATVGIGIWAAVRGRGDQEDYFLGGRRVSAFAMALSAVSSGRSAWLLLGASGAAWAWGLSAVWLFPGYIAAETLMFVGLGPRLRRRTTEHGAITVPEALQRLALGPDGQEGTSRLPIGALAGLVTVLFLTTYVSAQLVGGGKALEVLFEVDGRTWGLAITAIIVLVYTVLGGYRAVVATDVVQAVFMLGGLVVLPLLALHHVGGLDGLLEGLRTIDARLPADERGLLSWNRHWVKSVGWVAIGLGSFGNPHILVRHMSLRDPREARAAAITGTFWNVVMAAGAFLMGLTGRVIHQAKTAFPDGDPEHLFGLLAESMAAEYLFAAFAGVLLAALFAAVMSTCDSQLLVIASSLVRDFRGRRRDAGGGRGLRTSRIAVAVALGAAALLSFGRHRLILDFVLLSWGALGAAFGPPLILLLYDRRTSARGVLAGILVGAGTAWAWRFGLRLGGDLYELIPAFFASLTVTWVLRRW